MRWVPPPIANVRDLLAAQKEARHSRPRERAKRAESVGNPCLPISTPTTFQVGDRKANQRGECARTVASLRGEDAALRQAQEADEGRRQRSPSFAQTSSH